ncbi:MAG: aldose 1-epimerase family protein [Candidatus Eremiobacteraeota bacterium]|nr:aldose 1-epimerase family protein [Candidatus Eremiobacteraeota bacterium]MBC5821041.1 aldose 1-epimerase family protein [Candidatus Eremiobacteraeota bacterium]
MPQLFGREYSRAELASRTGRLDVVAGITPLTLRGGREEGVRALAFETGSGFSFMAVADRALDVAVARYDGIPLCWRSCNDIAAPAYYDPHGDDFLRTFVGGLFTTCGLENFGPAGSDQWGSFGLHGRIDSTPAENIAYETRWRGDECLLEARGTFRETRVFGENVRFERRLRVSVGGRSLELHDEVSNDGGTSRPHMLLYHCNGGFPILGDAAELHVSHSSMRPRDAQAEAGLAHWSRGGPPDPAFKEQVFIHEPVVCDDGLAAAVLTNPTLRGGRGLALAIRFDPAQLPALFTWRMLGYGTYVMGMEPANCPTIEGRIEAEKRGTLPFLEPGETRSYDLHFEVLESNEDVTALLHRFPG